MRVTGAFAEKSGVKFRTGELGNTRTCAAADVTRTRHFWTKRGAFEALHSPNDALKQQIV